MKTATIHSTSYGFGGYRATIKSNGQTIASQLFKIKGWGQSHCNAAYGQAKRWIATHGCK